MKGKITKVGIIAIVVISMFAFVTSLSAAQPAVTRSIEPDEVCLDDVVNVTISFTATEDLLGIPVLKDVVPVGWEVTDMSVYPRATMSFDPDISTVGFVWATGISKDTPVTANYKLRVPSDAPAGTYELNGALYNFGEVYANVTGEDNVSVVVYNFTITFYSGWNLISTPISPADTSLLSVMASVGADNWTSVWSYDEIGWHRYDKEGPPFLNDLTEMDAGIGYWVKMSADDTLTITGSPPVVTSIDLAAGWNLVGYNSQVSMATLTALASLGDDWTSVWTYDETGWHRYNKEGPPFLNDLTEMGPNKGYWIEMSAAGTWTI